MVLQWASLSDQAPHRHRAEFADRIGDLALLSKLAVETGHLIGYLLLSLLVPLVIGPELPQTLLKYPLLFSWHMEAG